MGDPRVRRAIAIGSPHLLDALERPGGSEQDRQRAEAKLDRYLIRMSTRPTPYGSFAAVSLVRWGERTTVEVKESGDGIRTRPDMGWLVALCRRLDADVEVRAQSLWSVNDCLVEVEGRLHVRDGAGEHRSIRLTPIVRRAVRAAERPVPYADLRAHLLACCDASPEQIDELLTRLWHIGLLVTDLVPRITTTSPAGDLERRLRTRSTCRETARGLAELLSAMADLDAAPAEQGPDLLRRIARRAAELHDGQGQFTQTDLVRPVEGVVGARLGERCARAAELLLRIGPEPLGPSDVRRYRQAFLARYGAGREIPLLELFDPRTGLGPLQHNHGDPPGLDQARAATRASTLMDLALTAVRDQRRVVELDDGAVSALQTWTPSAATAPVSLELSMFVVAPSAGAVDRGQALFVVGPNLGASSAGRSFGRFADMFGSAGTDALCRVTAAENAVRPEAESQVEVVYLPGEARSANVVVRPVAHELEMVLRCLPGVAQEGVVPVSDVVVGVWNDRFYLRSRSRGRYLRPTARHMLNQHRAPDICRFVSELAADGSPQFSGFDWGPASGFPFLPRVQWKDVVLSPARWLLRLPPGDRSERAMDDPRAFGEHIAAWRSAWDVPAQVYLSVADNRLLLDLDRPRDVEHLRREARSCAPGTGLSLQEALPSRDHAWVPGEEGCYIAEVVVPLVLRPPPDHVRPRAPSATAPQHRPPAVGSRDRCKLPGSEWLYAKLYCSPDRVDELLAGPLLQLCAMAETSGLADRWFFLRYADPEPHVRLRWKGDLDALVRHLIPQLHRTAADLLDRGTVTRMVLDTYDRELERYGGLQGIEISERIFWADSRAVARLLARESDPSSDITVLAAVTIDDLLAALGLDPAARLRWYTQQTAGPQHHEPRRRAGEDFRARQRYLRDVLGDDGLASLDGDVAEILRERRRDLEEAGLQLAALEVAGRLETSVTSLLASYVHMHCNRLLGVRPVTETHLLHLLQRTRKSLEIAPLRQRARLGAL